MHLQCNAMQWIIDFGLSLFICCSSNSGAGKMMSSIYRLLRHLLHRFFQYSSPGIVYACKRLVVASYPPCKMDKMNSSWNGPFHVLAEVFLYRKGREKKIKWLISDFSIIFFKSKYAINWMNPFELWVTCCKWYTM